MKSAIIIFSSCLIVSCASHEFKLHKQTNSELIPEATINDTLRQLVLTNVNQINAICDSIILTNNANYENQKSKSIWLSTTTAFTAYAPNILGEIAAKAGDSTECIIVELTVYNNENLNNARKQKNSIMISVEDTGCSKKLEVLNLKLDSTDRFIFGVNRKAIE